MALTITTNNVPRDIVDAWQLNDKEQAEFDYLDWPAIKDGNASASFFRYRGQLYDLAEFSTTGYGGPDQLSAWDGYASDSVFSGTVVRYVDEFERVIVGTYCS